MATLCRAYSDAEAARDAIDELLAAGTAGREIRLVCGSTAHDVRREVAGGFAKPVGPDAPVGRFRGAPICRWQGAGIFAGDADYMRQGSFGDVDTDAIVTFGGNAEHARIAGDREVKDLLRRSELNNESADELVDELHAGHGLVLIDLSGT
jgi:hypothetical protein